ncbi:conserved hypothetical protein [Hyella patelloides LEGE 07179]|uniref:Uncharacterized protein n=1 Tax=Hyella patelloides LEGE 07179 TaxID=945734 RepID=A0A563VXW6_9CYAN|nr:hypothetical protein [Hyella patelloides]VEP16255.1 conserved hypothetical protein [Hyella patelloides LEGE 07179]
MHSINIIVRNTALPISIERKEADDAEKAYQEILSAMTTDNPKVLELTCEKQEGKKIAVVSSAIAAAVMSQSSGANTNRAAGFFAAASAE